MRARASATAASRAACRAASSAIADGRLGRSDQQDAVEAATPVGERSGGFTAQASVALDLEDERGLDDGDGSRVIGEDGFGPLLLGGDDGGMDDGVQFVEAVAVKSQTSKRGAVKLAVGQDDGGSEAGDDRAIDGLAGLHELATE